MYEWLFDTLCAVGRTFYAVAGSALMFMGLIAWGLMMVGAIVINLFIKVRR